MTDWTFQQDGSVQKIACSRLPVKFLDCVCGTVSVSDVNDSGNEKFSDQVRRTFSAFSIKLPAEFVEAPKSSWLLSQVEIVSPGVSVRFENGKEIHGPSTSNEKYGRISRTAYKALIDRSR
jgi:hypothetical protein